MEVGSPVGVQELPSNLEFSQVAHLSVLRFFVHFLFLRSKIADVFMILKKIVK